jgi:hypothetical protein
MKAIDRIMLAYERKHLLTAEQAQRVRSELSTFIHELMYGKAGQSADVQDSHLNHPS